MEFFKNPLTLVVVGILVMVGAFFYYSNGEKRHHVEGIACDTKTEKYKLSEDDYGMLTVIKPGQEVEVEMGYYTCNEPKDNDVVLVQTSGKTDPIIRIVKVVPDDRFEVEKVKDKYNLSVNGSMMENLDGDRYQFHESKSVMLKLYEKSLQSKMIAGTYFIFTNEIGGGYDSTRFGPIEKEKLLGRIVLHK